MRVATEKIQTLLQDASPKLDHVLKNGPINEFVKQKDLSEDLIRRSGVCVFAPELLQGYLRKFNVQTNPHFRWIGSPNSRRDNIHRILKMPGSDDRYFDPTWQQFFYFTGLMPQTAQHDQRQIDLYPRHDIAVFEAGDTSFPDSVADHAHEIDQQLGGIFPERKRFTQSPLMNTTREEKSGVYREVWNTESYMPDYHSHSFEVRRALAKSTDMLCKL